MSLIVEDGTGLRTAESYMSVADATAYHTAFGNTAWTQYTGTVTGSTLSDMETALRRATQYIDAVYWFRGARLNYFQALRWPRAEAGILIWFQGWPPRPLVQATAELALRAITNLAAPLLIDVTDQSVLEERVGPIDVKYAPQVRNGQMRYGLIDNILKPLTGNSMSTVRVEIG